MKWYLIFFPSLLGLDVVSKILAIQFIPLQGIPLFKTSFISFSLTLVTNTGAAWGILPNHPGLLFSLRVLITLALIACLIWFNRGKYHSFPLWLIVTGAIGNQIDYLAYGHVIDFLHFTFGGWSFPIFNLADSLISIGVFALLLLPKKRAVA